jgi:replicative DNA helicase
MAESAATPERTLPHNLEAERSVLGAVILRNEAINEAAEVIDADDFYRDAHRRIFEKMIALSERNDAIDLITLKEELSRSGDLDEVGGPAYIARLVDGVPRTTNVGHYARIIKEKSTLRALIQRANDITVAAYSAEQDAEEILDEAERSIFEIADKRTSAGFTPLSDLVRRTSRDGTTRRRRSRSGSSRWKCRKSSCSCDCSRPKRASMRTGCDRASCRPTITASSFTRLASWSR